MSTVTADRTGKFVLMTYSLTASRCFTEAHLAGVISAIYRLYGSDGRIIIECSMNAL